jgi:hypothetical protein
MSETREIIHRVIRDKAILKQDVFYNTQQVFQDLRLVLKEVLADIEARFAGADVRVTFDLRDKGDFQTEMKIAGDVLIFQMHTNVFQIDQSHSLWKSGYLKDQPENSYVGIINIYNFLADSFKYQRMTDVGYLIGRIFVNREDHFLVQGKRQLGYQFNDFVNAKLDHAAMTQVIEAAVMYTLDFDLLTPPYENMQILSVEEIQGMGHSQVLATGKRLGFQFGLTPKTEGGH